MINVHLFDLQMSEIFAYRLKWQNLNNYGQYTSGIAVYSFYFCLKSAFKLELTKTIILSGLMIFSAPLNKNIAEPTSISTAMVPAQNHVISRRSLRSGVLEAKEPIPKFNPKNRKSQGQMDVVLSRNFWGIENHIFVVVQIYN